MHTDWTRLALPGDLGAVWELYAEVTADMAGTTEDVGWEMGAHPSRAQLDRAVADRTLLIATPSDAADVTDASESPSAASGRSTQAAPFVPSTPEPPSVLGAVIVDTAAPEGYAGVPWRVDAGPGEAGVIHLLAVSPRARGRGVARRLLDAAAELAAERGMRALRLDVFPNASHAARVYTSLGFVDLGLHTITYTTCDNTTFRLFEREL